MRIPSETRRIMVTGGAGFIGSHLVRKLLGDGHSVLNVDSLTYAGNLSSLGEWMNHPEHEFVKEDVCEEARIREMISRFRPDWIFHLAAETHVDRSIDGPMKFFRSNVMGTASMLQGATSYWESLPEERKSCFRFIHTSTDEVFGSVEAGASFDESSPYAPGSPYSASKAASDHAVRAWGNTYGLPVIVTNCSNNYGPFQYPEKLVPVVILNALRGAAIPVYGKGENIRDWLHVEDHCEALVAISENGIPGQSYNISGGTEIRNIDLVHVLCKILKEEAGVEASIIFVADRPGHDFRYGIDAGKIRRELGWEPRWDFYDGLRATVRWYLESGTSWGSKMRL